MVIVIIPAAGQGKRMGAGQNKVLLPLAGRPVLFHSLYTFAKCPQIKQIIVVSAADEVADMIKLLMPLEGLPKWQVVAGGSERQYSIANALSAVAANAEVVLVHDAARPLISRACVERVIEGAYTHQAVVAAVPVKNTIKLADKEGVITDTPKRSELWSVQTPQGFEVNLLKRAYQQAAQDDFLGTDDASLVERMGVKVRVVPGSYENIKITTPEDLIIAEALYQVRKERKGR